MLATVRTRDLDICQTMSCTLGSMPEKIDRNLLKVVTKTFRVIEVIAQYPHGIQLGEIASKSGKQPKATVFRILHTLKVLGYVQQDDSSGAYQLSSQLALLGRGEAKSTLKRIARPYLERLLGQFEQTVSLGALDHDQLQYVQILEGLRSIRMNATVNSYAPLHSTSLGKAILSKLQPTEVHRLLGGKSLARLTSKTIPSVTLLKKHLAQVLQQGFAVDDEETEEGARCIGAVICGLEGQPVAAISISGPLSLVPFERVPEIAREVKRSCRSISELLGVQHSFSGFVEKPRALKRK